MKILGIESSCDEFSAAVVEDGATLYSNVVHSQIDIHQQYGGVVPEVAARNHLEVAMPVVEQALAEANVTWDDIDAIAVTYAPGLIGSLLVGTLTARTLALLHDKPLYPIHHVEAHVYANFIVKQVTKADGDDGKTASTQLQLPSEQPKFPMLALIVSGGHTQLVLFRDHGDYTLLGATRDDAVGEAFDKVAKILGLPYPGGPSISNAAELGDPHQYNLPQARLDTAYEFSFSGLKTAVLRAVQRDAGVGISFPSHELADRLSDAQKHNFAASFQYTAVKTLVDATEQAFLHEKPASVVIAGGVAANSELRSQLQNRLPITIEYAPLSLCTDNAAMIATLGYYEAGSHSAVSPFELTVTPSLSMVDTVRQS